MGEARVQPVIKRRLGRHGCRRSTDDVPIIAIFFGIIIRMFYKEHEPAHSTPSIKANRASSTFRAK